MVQEAEQRRAQVAAEVRALEEQVAQIQGVIDSFLDNQLQTLRGSFGVAGQGPAGGATGVPGAARPAPPGRRASPGAPPAEGSAPAGWRATPAGWRARSRGSPVRRGRP